MLCIGGPDQIEENHYHGETNEVHKLGLDLYRGHKIHAEALLSMMESWTSASCSGPIRLYSKNCQDKCTHQTQQDASLIESHASPAIVWDF